MKPTRKQTIVKDVLWIFATIGLVAAIVRFTRGLGPSTALSDATPWGFWIGFDVTAGVALAAGGFTIAAVVYIFHLEKYRPIVRPAILTAFLGYGAVIVGLLVDLGLPWHIWSPIINWQPHSVLFEVAWCVMLYTFVLALEFTPTVLEHPWFQSSAFRWLASWLKRLILPLVIAGIVLSTLHQSSLGSLFLIMPFRLHPLWYSPLLPVLFFVSAVALGLMMVTLEGFTSAYIYDHPLRFDLFSGLRRAAGWILWLYLVLRLGDLAMRGVLPMVLDGSWQSFLFLFEIGISALLPAILLLLPSVRNSRAGLLTCAVLVVFGMILNRLSTSFIAMYQTPGTSYFPSWLEIALSVGIVAGAGLVFLFLTENLRILDPELDHQFEPLSVYDKPIFDPNTRMHLGYSWWDTIARRSFALVLVVAVTVALLPPQAVTGQFLPYLPVKPAQGWNIMTINGDRDNVPVDFDHQGHQERRPELVKGDDSTCQDCHHLSKPNDEATACWECHQDMALPTSIFDHTSHQVEMGGNASCVECHQGEHTRHTAKACGECHETMAMNRDGTKPFNHFAAGYKDAMHGACITCHQAEASPKPELTRCPACHKLDQGSDAVNLQALR